MKMTEELMDKVRWGRIDGTVTDDELKLTVEFFQELETNLKLLEPHYFLARSNVSYVLECHKKSLATRLKK
jgi:hypothetical protein